MKQLLIIGARGFGREIYNMAHECVGYGETFVIKGFLDDKADALEGCAGYAPILDSVEHYEIQSDDVFICALGDVRYKKKYIDIVLAKGGEFITLIHRTAFIDRNTTIGKGCVVHRYDSISCDIMIGDFVTMQPFVAIGHDTQIGNYCHLNTNAFMGGYVVIEDEVTLHTNAFIHPHKRVAKGAVVGVGSIVLQTVKAGTIVFGIPAREIGKTEMI